MMAMTDSQRLVVKCGGRLRLLKVDEIDWIEAAANYVRLHVGSEECRVRQTISSLEAGLDPSRFVRVHRSRIVNVERIREVEPVSPGRYVATLANGARMRLSRGGRARLLAILMNGNRPRPPDPAPNAGRS
jgi:two-component system LytT family response regulator